MKKHVTTDHATARDDAARGRPRVVAGGGLTGRYFYAGPRVVRLDVSVPVRTGTARIGAVSCGSALLLGAPAAMKRVCGGHSCYRACTGSGAGEQERERSVCSADSWASGASVPRAIESFRFLARGRV